MPTWLKIVGPVLAIAGAIIGAQAYVDSRIHAALGEQAAATALAGNIAFESQLTMHTLKVLHTEDAATQLETNADFKDILRGLLPSSSGSRVYEVPVRFRLENEVTTEMTGYDRNGRTVRQELGAVANRYCFLTRVSGYFDGNAATARVFRDGNRWIVEASQRSEGKYEIQAGAACIVRTE